MNKDLNYSYWELTSYFKHYDLVVIGAGIVGLSTAISYKQKHKIAKILVLERGRFPEGASTKNAGFACFGSAGEILDDIKRSSDKKIVWETVKMRWEGLGILKKRLGQKAIDYNEYGGFELFESAHSFHAICEQLDPLNKQIQELLGIKNCYGSVKSTLKNFIGFNGAVLNKNEGQLDSGKMMLELENLVRKLGIQLLYNIEVQEIQDLSHKVEIKSSKGVFSSKKCVVASNGFANQLLKLPDLQPARAQVLITSPIPNLKIKGSFHFQSGYYYFRNIHNRLLFGGGRQLDFKKETTKNFGLNKGIQNHLETVLKDQILPKTKYQIDYRWSGIMGIGSEKKPIIQTISKNLVAAVRMGGMGIAIGSKVGELAAELAD